MPKTLAPLPPEVYSSCLGDLALKTIVIALGGNTILQRGEKGYAEEQILNVRHTAQDIATLVKEGYRVVLTHGNGPQVGNILIQNEVAKDVVPCMPMDICGAQSQGMIGYIMQSEVGNALRMIGRRDIPVVSMVTQTVVDPEDPAFSNPTKPVGPFRDETYALSRQRDFGETWVEDSGRGWRRVVPSPEPKAIAEASSIKTLVDANHVVIAVGGGGIPVVEGPCGQYKGVDAVVEKDLGAQILATSVGAETLLILTFVNGAALHYNTPEETWLRDVSVEELRKYSEDSHFRKGSMGPKVEAIIRFVEHGGQQGIIASRDQGMMALKGLTGTRCTRAE